MSELGDDLLGELDLDELGRPDPKWPPRPCPACEPEHAYTGKLCERHAEEERDVAEERRYERNRDDRE